jgi:cellulose synthase/poly-beta-1,6-N-acetylglucosamine synthase-like glycosyltransferase
MTILFYLTLFTFLFPFIGYLRRDPRAHLVELAAFHSIYPMTTALIPAHNEGRVINQIIEDCNRAGFAEIVIVADRCTDNTASIAQARGCRVILVDCGSKTKALNEAMPRIIADKNERGVLFVFDADNRIHSDFLHAILPYFDQHDMVQCRVRNSNTNTWVARMYLIMMGSWVRFQDALTVCHASNILCGTGWGARIATLRAWPQSCRTLTEDLEYTGITRARIYFARDVDTFDEKPTNFGVSMRQRTRWVRGAWQVIFTRARDFDPRKWYVLALPIINSWFCVLFFKSLLFTHSSFVAWLFSFVMSSVINMIYYAMLLDRRDLARISMWDLLSYTAWCFTNYPIVLYGLITWHVSAWYRTPHVGGAVGK